MAETLHGLGYTVYALRLTGHGTNARELHGARWTHWVNDVENGLAILSAQCKETILCGFSMGGTLSIQAAGRHPEIKALITLDAPIDSDYRWSVPLFKVLSWVIPFISPIPLIKFIASAERKQLLDERIQESIGYTTFSVRSLAELFGLMAFARQQVSKIQQPTLILHSRKDDVVPFANGEYLLEQISAEHKEHLWLENSLHNVIRGPEAEQLKEKIINFLATYD